MYKEQGGTYLQIPALGIWKQEIQEVKAILAAWDSISKQTKFPKYILRICEEKLQYSLLGFWYCRLTAGLSRGLKFNRNCMSLAWCFLLRVFVYFCVGGSLFCFLKMGVSYSWVWSQTPIPLISPLIFWTYRPVPPHLTCLMVIKHSEPLVYYFLQEIVSLEELFPYSSIFGQPPAFQKCNVFRGWTSMPFLVFLIHQRLFWCFN